LPSLKPIETGQIANTDIFTVKNDYTNVYFVKTGVGYILIDAGSNPNKLKTSLDEVKIDINNVNSVFITHSDFDHIAGLTLFSNAEILMSEDELRLKKVLQDLLNEIFLEEEKCLLK